MGRLSVSLLFCTALALIGAVVEPLHVVKRSTCPSGWTIYGARCFLFVPTKQKWIDAEKNCLSQGANLASVHSDAEYQFIQKLIEDQGHGTLQTWLGGSDAVKEGQWLWSDGRVFDHHHWAKGEPNNNKGHQNCVLMNWGGKQQWDDQKCDINRASICAGDI